MPAGSPFPELSSSAALFCGASATRHVDRIWAGVRNGLVAVRAPRMLLSFERPAAAGGSLDEVPGLRVAVEASSRTLKTAQ